MPIENPTVLEEQIRGVPYQATYQGQFVKIEPVIDSNLLCALMFDVEDLRKIIEKFDRRKTKG